MRFSLLRALAWRQCFFEMARPNRAMLLSLSAHNTVNHLSRLGIAFSNTLENAAVFDSRLNFLNRKAK